MRFVVVVELNELLSHANIIIKLCVKVTYLYLIPFPALFLQEKSTHILRISPSTLASNRLAE